MRFFLLVAIALPVLAQAAVQKESLKLAGEYFAQIAPSDVAPVNQCADDPQPCIQYGSERSSSYDKQSVLDFVKACKGNVGIDCVKYVAERSSIYDKPSLLLIAGACRANVSNSCVKYASERTSSYDLPTLLDYARACQAYFNGL